MNVIALAGGQFSVAGNRWDLLADTPPRQVSVAVVVPYFDQQRELDLVLAALDAQDYPAELLQIVVADDGSAQPPSANTHRVTTSVVRQQDLGFRAAAARNLGAAHADAEVLCFLDADTVPQRDYIRNITALPSLCPEALVVGRRRHADFTGWTPSRLRRWWSGGEPPAELGEPRWLTDEYARSRDLLTLHDRSYRYIISSVMCCHTELFRDMDGFDSSFVEYGGEDWDFAHRAVIGGAVLRHERGAVAWHHGPDWAARDLDNPARIKNAETLAVARRVPDTELRVAGMVYDIPAVAVAIDANGHGPGSLLASIGSFLDLDVGVWVIGADAERLLGQLRLTDPRIRVGPIPARVLQRCRYLLTVAGRAVLPRAAVAELVRRCGYGGAVSVSARVGQAGVHCAASWAVNRARRCGAAQQGGTHSSNVWRFGDVVELPGEAIGLTEVPPDCPC